MYCIYLAILASLHPCILAFPLLSFEICYPYACRVIVVQLFVVTQKLCDDIVKHSSQLTAIVETPLLEKTSQHSSELLSGLETKIGYVRARYEALLVHVEGRMAILQENLQLCRLFNEDHLRLFAFISETELRLLDGQSNLNDCKPSPVKEVLRELEVCI